MVRLFAVLLAVLLLAPEPACPQASADVKAVVFNTSPPGAQVILEMKDGPLHLGRSGDLIPLDLSRTRESFQIRIELDGFEPDREQILPNYFNDRTQWPESGARLLQVKEPLKATAYLATLYGPAAAAIGGSLAAVACGVFFGVVRPRWRRLRKVLDEATRWQAFASQIDTSDPLAGRDLGGYRLVEKLGSGGMATVYRAVPIGTFSEVDSVAVKVVNPELSKDEEFRRRFRREVRTCSQLDHPGIVRLINWSTENDELLFMVMELVRGETLRHRIIPGGLPPAEVLRVLRPVAAAVGYAHEHHIVHRDLKPDNIMIVPDGRTKVMDFGLARGHDYSALTATGTVMGTPAYMPPEQIQGGDFDPRADQYALGVIAYQMLTGTLPFTDDNPMTLLFKHITQAPPPLRQLRPDLPEAAEAVVLRMLAKDPAARYPSVREAIDALEPAMAAA